MEENSKKDCLSCGEVLTGRYCSGCGEKVLIDEERSVSHYLGEAVHAITHADGKFLKSLGLLFSRPGTLTLNYLGGMRKKYMSPLSLFVFANLLYLMLSPLDALTSQYVSQRGQLYGSMVQETFEKKREKRGWTELQLSERYNAKSGKLAKLLLFLLVLFFSVPVALVNFSRKRFYVDHLVFSTEAINFLILFFFLILPWILTLVFAAIRSWFGIAVPFDVNDKFILVAFVLCLTTYLTIISWRLYHPPAWLAITKGLLLFVGLFLSVQLYRFTLFQATMALL